MTEVSSNKARSQNVDRIRKAREENPNLRERDLAQKLEISEAEFIAAFCGISAKRIAPRFSDIFPGLQQAGEVMALTRNESAVHEKIGVFEKFVDGKGAAMMLGAQIDTRMFPSNWVYGFSVEKQDGEHTRRSLQFFDAHGDAVQKIHSRPDTDLEAWQTLVDKLTVEDQEPGMPPLAPAPAPKPRAPAKQNLQADLQSRWEGLKDPHQFHSMLKDFELHRLSAFELVGEKWAWKLDTGSVVAMLRLAADEGLPIMCFVGNKGCIQIHSGPISKVMDKGPWINVLDPTFHLHLRTDHIADVWAVRKPADTEHVTSIEAFDSDGNQLIQFFGVRKEGNAERSDWRNMVDRLPKISALSLLGAAE
ncbi:hemin-degrading factor [Roseibium algae]|uniref:ChuX/HutX family heme-like substrate-binding protein n=1 Tax=Roseibium algae TaxID=3123038 RepID=A0ABU8TG41_9HYPH